jgi:ABC-type multidrug transport system ATPase subunit
VIRELRGLDPEALRGAAARLDLDLEAVAGRPVRALSGGMRQKLLIAIALSTGASLLILDEPTASLDAPARQAFFGLMEERARAATVLLCSHRLEEVRHLVDHVVALRGGRVAYAGPVEEYLRARAFSVVELYTEGSTLDAWLAARGFRRGAPGSWARTVSHGEKAGLLREVLATFNGALRNLVVRDLDAIEDGADPPASAGAEPPPPEGAKPVGTSAAALGARAGDRP